MISFYGGPQGIQGIQGIQGKTGQSFTIKEVKIITGSIEDYSGEFDTSNALNGEWIVVICQEEENKISTYLTAWSSNEEDKEFITILLGNFINILYWNNDINYPISFIMDTTENIENLPIQNGAFIYDKEKNLLYLDIEEKRNLIFESLFYLTRDEIGDIRISLDSNLDNSYIKLPFKGFFDKETEFYQKFKNLFSEGQAPIELEILKQYNILPFDTFYKSTNYYIIGKNSKTNELFLFDKYNNESKSLLTSNLWIKLPVKSEEITDFFYYAPEKIYYYEKIDEENVYYFSKENINDFSHKITMKYNEKETNNKSKTTSLDDKYLLYLGTYKNTTYGYKLNVLNFLEGDSALESFSTNNFYEKVMENFIYCHFNHSSSYIYEGYNCYGLDSNFISASNSWNQSKYGDPIATEIGPNLIIEETNDYAFIYRNKIDNDNHMDITSGITGSTIEKINKSFYNPKNKDEIYLLEKGTEQYKFWKFGFSIDDESISLTDANITTYPFYINFPLTTTIRGVHFQDSVYGTNEKGKAFIQPLNHDSYIFLPSVLQEDSPYYDYIKVKSNLNLQEE